MLSLGAFLYDRVMKSIEEACLKEWRQEILSQVHGRVLEIGAGTGASLAFYPQKDDLKVYLLEPDRFMRSRLNKNLNDKVNGSDKDKFTIINSSAEKIGWEDNFFDFVFVSLVCCSLKDLDKALNEIKRVLKKGGKFLFIEHVAAQKGTKTRKMQDFTNIFWRPLAGNCHLNRETEKHIKNAGFEIESIIHDEMITPFSLVKPSIRGVAVKK